MSLQQSIIFLAVALSVAYLAYRTWKAFRDASDPCHGCPGCALRDESLARQKRLGKNMKNRMKPPCEEKK